MTFDEAKTELVNFDHFAGMVCDMCTANDWYCPTFCDMLEKTRTLDFNRIIKYYAKHDGDIRKVRRYILNTKICRVKGGY